MDKLKNNVLSNNHTHFLQGVNLIQEGREVFDICSENYTYPLKHYGDPSFSEYYGEVWSDGMDWNVVYWLIESANFSDPKALPMIIFDSGDERNKFIDYDFYRMIKGFIWKRKANTLQISDEKSVYVDTTWAFLHSIKETKQHGNLMFVKCFFEHGSQEKVEFWVNSKFLLNGGLIS